MSRSRRNTSAWEDEFDDGPESTFRRSIGDESIWSTGEWDDEDDFSFQAGSSYEIDDEDFEADRALPFGR